MQSLKKTGRRYHGMSNQQTYRQYFSLLLNLPAVMGAFFLLNFTSPAETAMKTGILKITLRNTVNGVSLVLNDSLYTNVFGESYSVSKFKYYISNPGVKNSMLQQKEKSGYHLVDATIPVSQNFSFAVKAGEYNNLFFLLGVDSAHNCSGAQTGALDPMNDMFWTWNSGYVMTKLEGRSTASSSINQRMEYHIGGYKGKDNVLQQVSLAAAVPIVISAGKTTEVIIETDISKWWQAGNPVSIKETPICTTPGQLAKKISINCSRMFMIRSVRNN